ncbi:MULTISPECIES: hypothetical protein [unclassified Pseudomonas]|uniref:hypothetical protein n=1 Tax=unclassified Pseudomonas TaxID=196821 RepID=UPI000C86A86D|nr:MULTISPECIES: hypothetical protein [unclassified Pseudomonas]PMV79911.1 hypothetical protein C1X56_31620 [Pseudomonas sp. GW101-1A09]PMV85672.1 hypothetical protein C1X51_30050 [Pseudomonas sp. FW306-2-2C-B10A]PMV90687.1 hypothetical protein C1X55_32290 [Pseudomonas sp. GW460-C8]PMV97475.1 hypothetical protein C1X50_31535 [Pseudomonas sp. MPR-TSA4]PMW07567.1 hypothetical protein C1X52_30070 [Pseudomonas sp. FW306-2-1A-C05A]
MRNLIALPDDPTYLDRFVAIRDKKHKVMRANLTAAHALIEERYLAYAEAIDKSSLAGLKSHAPALLIGETLRACYDGATQPLKQLKQAIKDAQPKRLLKYCPMCGTTLPSTFDHYMPAVKFPEFAVHPLNLVPCCAKCNSTKDADWLSGAGKRQFLHSYTDPVPDLQFVVVTFHEIAGFKGVGATFSLTRPIGLTDELWDLIGSHFQRLKLIDRYDELGNDEVAEILKDCRIHLDSGGQDLRVFLSGRAKDRRDVYGRNHWIAVLMESMAKHVNLENWVQVA